jgi:hypothetical protein
MYKLPSKSQYHIGNDHAIPDSAFVASSYLDGIYTQFDKDAAPHGWLDVQDTFKLDLPQDKWGFAEDDPRAAAASGLVTSALYTSGYDHATTGLVHKQFGEIEVSGRSEYVDGVEQESHL